MPEKRITLPLTTEAIRELHAGDIVLLSGTVYTARDAAHARFDKCLKNGEELPIRPPACIYYAGPCPAAPGEIIGPCGPTTAKRMDVYTPDLIEYGVGAFIGKGPRSSAVKDAMLGRAVYFAVTGGAAVLIASCIKNAELVAYGDLGTEAVRVMQLEDMPAIVAVDSYGEDLYCRPKPV